MAETTTETIEELEAAWARRRDRAHALPEEHTVLWRYAETPRGVVDRWCAREVLQYWLDAPACAWTWVHSGDPAFGFELLAHLREWDPDRASGMRTTQQSVKATLVTALAFYELALDTPGTDRKFGSCGGQHVDALCAQTRFVAAELDGLPSTRHDVPIPTWDDLTELRARIHAVGFGAVSQLHYVDPWAFRELWMSMSNYTRRPGVKPFEWRYESLRAIRWAKAQITAENHPCSARLA